MGRFLVLVLVLAGIGLAINYATNENQPVEQARAEQRPAEQAAAVEGGPMLRAAGATAAEEVAVDEASTTLVAETTGSAEDSVARTGEATVEDGSAESETPAGETPAEPPVAEEAEVESTDASALQSDEGASLVASSTEVAASDGNGSQASRLPIEEIVATAEPAPEEEVMLGTDELTQGIPGSGSLTIEEIREWLGDERNHAVLKPSLPLGLAAAASQIVGIEENPLTRAKIELGRQLFFDPRLSADHTISCASCHHPDFGYAKDTQFGEGVGGQTGNRNSPVAYNRILSGLQFWDGRAETLEEQAKGPIANPVEMSNTHDVCVEHLSGIEGYQIQFERIFPDGVNIENVVKAIASFERALVTGPSPWDYYEQLKAFEDAYAADLEELDLLQEDDPELYEEYMALKKAADEHPMNESARRGAELFFSDRAACTACHVGANFTDELYHNIGVGMDAETPDLGRYEITKDEKDKGAFKTPTVRNVALTAPYMHDGSQQTLQEVVEWYDKGGHPNPYLDERIKPLGLTEQEKKDLVAFMEALTGPLPEVEAGRLPQ